MQIVIEWFDENHRTLYRRTTEDWLCGEDRGEIIVKPPIPEFDYHITDGSLTDHAIKLIESHFSDKIVGFRVKVLLDDERLGAGDL